MNQVEKREKSRGRPLKHFSADEQSQLPDLTERIKRARVLNTRASRKHRELKRRFLHQQEKELKRLEKIHYRLKVKVNNLTKVISILKPFCFIKREEGIWRPWLDNTKCIITILEPIK